MPRITSFVYCEDAKQEMTNQGVKLHVSNPFASLLPMFVPGSFSFSVCIGIAGINPEKEHTLRYIFRPTDNSSAPLIDTGELKFFMSNDPGLSFVPIDYQGAVLSMDFKNTVFRKNGEYVSDIYINGELVAEYPIMVHGRESL
ncbi:MAG: hypothetical protein LKI04_29195 [Paenibacillus lautus]|uniref:DUF6941 family protein n=1 Tax=Paenibacillus lautus TaxID=1401 RepID=UPI0026F1207C|nr:hypothetical protein [Paenibacillus lautus]MCI1778098.1 hypothetical protein [Paenibacillus lautus]